MEVGGREQTGVCSQHCIAKLQCRQRLLALAGYSLFLMDWLMNLKFGRILIPEHMHGSTMGFVRNFFKRDYSALALLPPRK